MIAFQSRAICTRSARRNDVVLYWFATFGRRFNRLRTARRPPISRSLSDGTMTHSIRLSLAPRARPPVRHIAKIVSCTPAHLRLDRRWKLYVRSPASGGTGSIRVSQRHRSGLRSVSMKSRIDSDVIAGKTGRTPDLIDYHFRSRLSPPFTYLGAATVT